MPVGKSRLDEESLVQNFPDVDRKALGAFYTPAELVQAVLEAVRPHLPQASGHLTVVDPAAGAGAFLEACAETFTGASIRGIELHRDAAAWCVSRVPEAEVVCADALRVNLDELLPGGSAQAFELWIGNPPYNGTSAVLRDPATYKALRALMPEALPPGQSLRDDFAFFLLRVAHRLRSRAGALAFVTPATLLDGFLYAPLRRALLEHLDLREVVEIGDGAFRGARVRTCITVWTSRIGSAQTRTERSPVGYRSRSVRGEFRREQLSPRAVFTPREPDLLFRPADREATALDDAWRAEGEAITTLVPISSPGLKTRFDELLVDDDAERLLGRVTAFLACEPQDLAAFAGAHAIPAQHLPKLQALKSATHGRVEARRQFIRPFFRYAGARHRGRIPESARAYCYLDRRLIPRGDHRFRGEWDPHAYPVKLVFNVRELPLAAAYVDTPGCIHDHRHARFAPLMVPARIHELGLQAARTTSQLGPLVPNLSAKGRCWAEELGGPAELFRRIAAFVNSPEVQDVWAPAFGAVRELHVTRDVLVRCAQS